MMMAAATILDGLNDAQRQVAEHRGSPLLVFAAAGTGKTQALTARIAHLVLVDGVSPSRVLALTFTRKAAGEMRRRAAALCGLEDERDLRNVGTFHSLCVRLLRKFSPVEGADVAARRCRLSRGFTILEPAQSEALLDACLPQALDDAFASPHAASASSAERKARVRDSTSPAIVMRVIDAWRNRGLEPDDPEVLADAETHDGSGCTWPLSAVAASAYASYRDACARRNVVDFSDLLLHACSLLERRPDVLGRCRRDLFAHLLVDEFQDTNPAQMRLVRLLCRGASDSDGTTSDEALLSARNLMVVGDDYQAIHEWRGATVRNILGFADDWPGGRTVCLSLNYRSVPQVLALARRVIALNVNQRHKDLIATRPDGGSASVIATMKGSAGQWAEARSVAARIAARICDGDNEARAKDFAVLYRVNAQSQPLEEALRAAGVPYRVRGSVAFFDRAEVRDAMAYARLLCNPRADADFERVLNSPPRGLGPAALAKLRERAAASACSLLAAAEVEVESNAAQLPRKRLAALEALTAALRELRQPPPFDVDDECDLDECDCASVDGEDEQQQQPLRACLERVGYLSHLRESTAADAADRLANVEALLALELRANTGLRDFVDACAVSGSDVRQQADGEVDAVTLMTLHASKGLEFREVFMVGCVEGWLPYARSLQEGRIEEERRLCYVGITRARDRLTISMPKSMHGYRGVQQTEPSRFFASDR